MKKNILAFLVIMVLLGACGGNSSPTPLPTAFEGRPTPSVAYQIVGSTKYTCMVVVDPKDNKDREGLLEIGDYLCMESQICRVWFWDDINKADTSFPIDPENEQTMIAFYKFDYSAWKGDLKVYTLGDAR
jgi:hypothetical protein